jgi:hypothetical protein
MKHPEGPHERRRSRRFQVTYDVRSGIDSAVVHTGRITVIADTAEAAARTAVRQAHENDPYCDARIDPVVEVRHVAEIDNEEADDG